MCCGQKIQTISLLRQSSPNESLSMSMLSLSCDNTNNTVEVQSARLGLDGASFSSAKKRETTLWARRCIRKLGFMHLLARLIQVRHLK
jgi:hypothetical protein